MNDYRIKTRSWRRAVAVAAVMALAGGAVSGCSLFGKDKNAPLPEPEFVPIINIKDVRKEKPGLPADLINARHTEEVLRGDDDT